MATWTTTYRRPTKSCFAGKSNRPDRSGPDKSGSSGGSARDRIFRGTLPSTANFTDTRSTAPKGNAVKHFRSRIRENSDDLRAFRILTNSATIRSQAFFRARNCFTALPERAEQAPSESCFALSGLVCSGFCVPGATFAGTPASLCPGLACSAPLGQRTARRTLVLDEPQKRHSPPLIRYKIFVVRLIAASRRSRSVDMPRGSRRWRGRAAVGRVCPARRTSLCWRRPGCPTPWIPADRPGT
jgi:hypothetical protein